jgi:hypothetical protein
MLIGATGMSAPVNDNFANRIPLSGSPVVTNGNNVLATREPGDPTTISGGICNATVWWGWTAPSNGQYAVVVIMKQPSLPLVAVYTWSMSNGLTQVTQSEAPSSYSIVRNGTNSNVFQVVFQATAGMEYQIIVGAVHPYQDAFELTISTPPSITTFTPTYGADFSPPANIPLTVEANDTDGSIVLAQYSTSSGPVFSASTNPPWSGLWTNVPVGRYQLTARVVDSTGASATTNTEFTVGRPPNDDFANRIMLTGLPVSTEVSILAAGLEPGESPAIGYYTSAKTVWWSWTAPHDGRYAVIASATNQVVVGVYTGTNVAMLQLLAFAQESHAAIIGGNSRFCYQTEWDAVGGTTYQIVVNSWGGSPVVGLGITVPPQAKFTTPPDGSVFASPASIPFLAEPGDVDGTLQQIAFRDVHSEPSGSSSHLIGALTNSPWSLVWNTPPVGCYPVILSVIDDTGAQTLVTNRIWVGVERPLNDDFAQSIRIPNLQTDVTVHGTNVWATTEPGERYGPRSIWWSWTAPASGTVTFDAIGSSYGTYDVIYTGSAISNLTLFATSSDPTTFPYSFTVNGGTTYWISMNGGDGNVTLHMSTPPAPPVHLESVSISNSSFRIQLVGVPGQDSVLEASTNLRDWVPIATNGYTGTLLTFEDEEAAAFAQRFYRVRQE